MDVAQQSPSFCEPTVAKVAFSQPTSRNVLLFLGGSFIKSITQ